MGACVGRPPVQEELTTEEGLESCSAHSWAVNPSESWLPRRSDLTQVAESSHGSSRGKAAPKPVRMHRGVTVDAV
eukprot:364305-Chlamydomonas_euryale.AAC.7